MWKIRFNPFNIPVDYKREQLIQFAIERQIDTKQNIKNYDDDKLKFYFVWYTAGVNKSKMCELLKEHFEKTGRLIKM